jgi:probable F420-dependent oxidoreductase
MEFGFSLVVRGNDATPETFVRMGERAEALELDSLWCSAHVIIPPQARSDYVLVPGLAHPEHWKERYWEPFTVLGYLAALTRRIKLGTSVVVMPMHNPIELAKQVAEVDQLSGGRFIFGLGVGWFEEEFEVLGQNFHNRGARTNEGLELMKALWAEDPVTFRGKYHSVEDAFFGPKPVQQPAPPIWVAGGSKAAMRRAARFGDAWHPARPSFAHLERSIRELAGYVEAAGRPAGSVAIAVKCPLVFQPGPPGADQPPTHGRPVDIANALERYGDLGVSHFVLDVLPETQAVALDTMERFAQEVRPRLT